MQIDIEALRDLELHDLTKALPHASPLYPKHDSEILDFFDQAGMGGKVRLLMQRKPRFHDLFDQRGGVSRVLGMRDSEGRLVGTGSLTSTPCFIGGEPGAFGYMSDLRIQTRDRAVRAEWRELFARILQYGPLVRELRPNGRLVCVIIESNARAIKVLKESTHNGQRLVPVAPYSMVTLLKRLPFRRKFVSAAYTIQQGGVSVEELEVFLHSVHKDQAFGQCFGAPHFELRRRLGVWKNFSLDDFFVVRDRAGRIVAATALWNPNHCKQSVVEGPWWTAVYNWIARPFGLPQFGKPLEISYFTHLTFSWDLDMDQRRHIFAALVDHVWPEKKKRGAEGLAFCDFKDYALSPALKGFVKAPVHVGMYLAMPESDVAGFDKVSLGKFPPAFELALV